MPNSIIALGAIGRQDSDADELLRRYCRKLVKGKRSVNDPPRGTREKQRAWYAQQIRCYLGWARVNDLASVVWPNMYAACPTPGLFDLAAVVRLGARWGYWRAHREGSESWRLIARCYECGSFHQDWRSDGKAVPCGRAASSGGRAG